jgi:hypothetical protein
LTVCTNSVCSASVMMSPPASTPPIREASSAMALVASPSSSTPWNSLYSAIEDPSGSLISLANGSMAFAVLV